jgi:hypothetical protein
MVKYFQRSTSAAPLAVFRIALGLLLFGSIVRFWSKGWIEDLYIKPKYFFPFYGFEFVKPLGEFTYVLVAICAICALMVALGFFYRASIIGLFLSFTYIELIDKSTYLNHYYFISMVTLLMIFLPAHTWFSVDAFRNHKLRADKIPQWTVDALKLFVCFLYFFAGLAKINSDWLLEAQPLRIWLPAKNDLPVIGSLFNHVWVAYAFSWMGCIYDLTIPFLLLNRWTRNVAYAAVVIFHLLTAMLFPIGMFPYIMIVTALVFFPGTLHEKIIAAIAKLIRAPKSFLHTTNDYRYGRFASRAIIAFFTVFFLIQTALPLRYLFYPGELFWTEEGYRFSWRVMLMEKAGYAQFTVRDVNGKQVVVNNTEFLTPLQEKMMATQPDMMVQYAHLLRAHFEDQGFESPEIYVDSYVALNGRLGKPLVDPLTDLGKENESFDHKQWISPFNDDIKGF